MHVVQNSKPGHIGMMKIPTMLFVNSSIVIWSKQCSYGTDIATLELTDYSDIDNVDSSINDSIGQHDSFSGDTLKGEFINNCHYHIR